MQVRQIYFPLLFLLSVISLASSYRDRPGSRPNATKGDERQGRKNRQGKFLSVFQVIRFANDDCPGTGGKSGTCFTEQECEAKGGVNGGSCAQGFGVCCIITLNCGESSNENCTFFDSNAVMDGSCQVQICPCNDNICQLRLDFNNFVITGPSMDTDPVTAIKAMSGVILDGATIPVAPVTQCLTDRFSVSNGDGPNPPTICGINTGEHMYVEANDCCNELSFILGAEAIGTAMAARAWSIKVTQFSCQFNNLAPQGCVQYFFDNAMDNIMTFNYDNGNGLHLADQDQQICIRREANFCRICYTVVNDDDFNVSGTNPGNTAVNKALTCCSYAGVSTSAVGYDCLHIPGALNKKGLPNKSNFCGNKKLLTSTLDGSTNMNTDGEVCSTRVPFTLNFRSDTYEVGPEAKGLNKGFTIQYQMDSINCLATDLTV